MAKYKTIIGRAELLDLPARLLTDIPAKTDTGAYYSSIHAENITEVTNKKGKKVLQFDLLANHSAYGFDREAVQFEHYETAKVSNSFGEEQVRYKVNMKVRMAGKVFITPFTLADRSKKPFPILMGRTLINKRFMVDTDITHVDRRKLKDGLKEWLKKDDEQDKELGD